MDKKRVLLLSDLHYCQEEYGGISRDEKAKRIVDFIRAEHEKFPFSAILFLGDYSLDHWAWKTMGSWLTEGKSYAKQFVQTYLQDLPAPHFFLPGNHEQFGEEKWRELTGCCRSGEMVVGDFLFILWDSYGANLDPIEHSDGTYTPINVQKTRAIMERYPDKKVILCSHFFVPTLSEEECALIRDERVVCLCMGHTHYTGVNMLAEEYGCKLVLQTGSWGGTGSSGRFPWGGRELYLEDGCVTSSYIVPAQTLFQQETHPYTVPAHTQDSVRIEL
jgi:UDP-2,3-diacylglucosamine pyrophosphatase LpxH